MRLVGFSRDIEEFVAEVGVAALDASEVRVGHAAALGNLDTCDSASSWLRGGNTPTSSGLGLWRSCLTGSEITLKSTDSLQQNN